jgi:uncharacterized protein with GYD domain
MSRLHRRRHGGRKPACRSGQGQGGGSASAWMKRGSTMPFYLYQLSYSPEAVKAMITKPSDRKAAAAKLIESIGGKLHHLFFSFGKYDVVCLIEAPDDASMAAGAMAVGASGTVLAAATTKLFTAEEAMSVMAKAGTATGAYKPPMD